MKIGERLKEHRDKSILTQEELGQLAGLSGFTISRIESNQVEPRVSTIRKIAEALDIAVSDLSTEAKSQPTPLDNISLENSEREKLEALATRWNVSLAEAVRRLIQLVP